MIWAAAGRGVPAYARPHLCMCSINRDGPSPLHQLPRTCAAACRLHSRTHPSRPAPTLLSVCSVCMHASYPAPTCHQRGMHRLPLDALHSRCHHHAAPPPCSPTSRPAPCAGTGNLPGCSVWLHRFLCTFMPHLFLPSNPCSVDLLPSQRAHCGEAARALGMHTPSNIA